VSHRSFDDPQRLDRPHLVDEGGISACFDSLDHEILLTILAEKIHDGRFLRLIADLLKAGYLEEWTFGRTLSGVPQGGVVSPVLSNVFGRLFGRGGTAASLLP
jgi:retron-type reverse transcriptase